jgi:signal transduction histidine kinase
VHTITMLHHGEISFDANPHQPGTTVLLRLPRRSLAPQH